MTMTVPNVEEMAVRLQKEVRVEATLANTFDALLEQLGANNETPDGSPMPMTLEAKPGGRWFRDLGDNNGHHWGHVQAIKRPHLLELSGPMFMSYAATSNMQYRLTAADGATLLTMQFSAFGLIPDEHRQGMASGWDHVLNRVKAVAEGK